VVFTLSQKIWAFLPVMLIALGAWCGVMLYINMLVRWIGPENLNSVAYLKRYYVLMDFALAMPVLLIAGPVIEGLIWRAPLIILFDEMSPIAWGAAIVSSVLFGYAHSFNPLVRLPEIVARQEEGRITADDLKVAHDQTVQLKSAVSIRFIRMTQVFLPALGGVFLCWQGTANQSLWTAIKYHTLWNLMVVYLLPFMLISFSFLVGAASYIDRRFRTRMWLISRGK